MQSRIICAALLLFVSSAVAIPQQMSAQERHKTLALEVIPTKCSSKISTECLADKCCNWCGVFFNASVGFCLPMIPTTSPALTCEREPTTCGAFTSSATCVDNGVCAWVPTGPPASGAGLCVYDWTACKAPAPAAVALKPIRAAAPKVEAPVAPAAPKLSCNLTTAEACDAKACCQWCGAAAGAGFCMPVIEWPTPALTCSKAGTTCSAVADAAACEASSMCSWHPFGPPGAAGPGICTFDTIKCSA